jgi:hypothetical protein
VDRAKAKSDAISGWRQQGSQARLMALLQRNRYLEFNSGIAFLASLLPRSNTIF